MLYRRYEVTISECVKDGVLEGYFVECIDRDTYEVVRHSEMFDNIGDAVEAFAELQRKWYDDLNVAPNNLDAWHLKIDITLY